MNVRSSICERYAFREDLTQLEVIAADHGYKVSFIEHIEREHGWRVEIVQKPESSRGFVPRKNRWPVEGSFGCGSPPGLNFRRRLSQDVDKTIERSEAMLRIGFISILINRLAK